MPAVFRVGAAVLTAASTGPAPTGRVNVGIDAVGGSAAIDLTPDMAVALAAKLVHSVVAVRAGAPIWVDDEVMLRVIEDVFRLEGLPALRAAGGRVEMTAP